MPRSRAETVKAEREPLYNVPGTHVYTTSPSGDPWECPPDYLPVALARGFTLADAPADHNPLGLVQDKPPSEPEPEPDREPDPEPEPEPQPGTTTDGD